MKKQYFNRKFVPRATDRKYEVCSNHNTNVKLSYNKIKIKVNW